MSHPHVGIRAI